MVAPAENTASLNALVSIANSKTVPKLIKAGNYEVISIKPLRLTTSAHNTVAEIQIDLAGESPVAILASDRYSFRRVEYTRIDLKDIAIYRGLEVNDKGQFIGSVADAAAAIELLNASILESEIEVVNSGDLTVVRAKSDSLGYVGGITFVAGEETETPPVVTPVQLTALMIVGPTTLVAEAETTFTVQPTPTGATVANLTWSATGGVIDNTGAFVAPTEAGTVTITATSGTITTTHVVTVSAAA